MSLSEISDIADVFYIGGTKLGALLGEAVVFPQGNAPKHFVTQIKQHGALLAQSRTLGAQFDALFSDNLYEKIGREADRLAQRVVDVMRAHGFDQYMTSDTNQQFFVMSQERFEKLSSVATVSLWEAPRDGQCIVRLVTSWDTTDGMVNELDKALTTVM